MTSMPGYPCPVCRRAGGAVTISRRNEQLAQVCSDRCAHIYLRSGPVSDKTETDAVQKTGAEAGAYLDSIGQSDLAKLTVEQWNRFRLICFREIAAKMQAIADDEIPF